MCSAVGFASANAVNAVPVAVAVETREAGRIFRYITVSLDLRISDFNITERVGNIISSLARNDNNDDDDDQDDQEGDADAERTADAASAEASFGNLLAVIVNPFVAVVNLFAHLEGNLFI